MDQLLAAVRLAYTDPNNAQRGEADQYIQRAKEVQGKGISSWGFALVSGQGGDALHTKHFGYHLLEDAVDKHWGEYTEDEVNEWKRQLIAMAAQETLTILQEKLAHVLAVVALRIWPQYWQDLWPTLGNMWNDPSPKRRAMAMRAFIAIHEETSLHSYRIKRTHELGLTGPSGRWDGRYIEAERKMAVLRAIEDMALGNLSMVNYFLNTNRAAVGAGRDQELLAHVGLALRIVKLYGANAAIGDVVEHSLLSWVELAGHPELRDNVAELLLEFVEGAGVGKGTDEAAAAKQARQNPMIIAVFKELLEFLVTFLKPDPRGAEGLKTEDGQAMHAFALRIADVCAAVTKNDWLFGLITKEVAGREVLKTVAIALLSHPAGTIHLHALHVTKKLLSNEATAGELKAMGEEFFAPLLHCVNGPHLVRVACDGQAKNIAGAYAALDFEDHQEDEWMHHHTHLTSAHREVAALINSLAPHATIKYFVHILGELLANPHPPANAPRNAVTGGLLREGEVYTAWAIAETCLMHFSDSLPKHLALAGPTPHDLVASLLRVIDGLLQLNIAEALLLPKHAGALQCVTHVIGREAGPHFPLGRVVEKFVGMMNYLAAGESVSGVLSVDTISARRRVQMSLMHVCEDFGSGMAEHLPLLLRAWTDYQSQQALTDQEVSLLTESITSVSNQLSETQRRQVVCNMVEPMMAPWTKAQSVLADKQYFLQYMAGLLQARGSHPEHDNIRSVMRKCLCVFTGVYRRSASVGAGTDDALWRLSRTLLGSILDLLVALNWAWTPGVLTGDATRLLTVTPEEKEQATGGAVMRHADLYFKGANLSDNERVLIARQYVCQLRAGAFALLGSLPSFFTSNYAEYQNVVLAKLFTPDLYYSELLQLKYLWNDFCVPFLLLTPEAYHATLPRVVQRIFAFFFDILNRGWAMYHEKYIAGGNAGQNTKFSSKQGVKVTTDDGWEMKVLTDLTTEVCSVLFHIANVAQGALVTNTKLKKAMKEPADQKTIAATCNYMCQDDNLVVSMLLLLTGAISWPGPSSSVHAVEALLKLMGKIAGRVSLHSAMCHMLGCSLHRVAVLQSTKSATSTGGAVGSAPLLGGRNSQLNSYLINLICELYITLHPVRPEPAQLLAQMGVSQEEIMQLQKGLETDNQPSKKRARFKALLNPPKENADATVIHNLPQYDILGKQRTAEHPAVAARKAADEYDITQAFSTLFT